MQSTKTWATMQFMIQQEAVNGLVEMALDMQAEIAGVEGESQAYKTACAELTRETKRQRLMGTSVLAKGMNIVNVRTRNGVDLAKNPMEGGNFVAGKFAGFLALPEHITTEDRDFAYDRWTIGAAVVRPTHDSVQDGFICPVESCDLLDLTAQLDEDFIEEIDHVIYQEDPSIIELGKLMAGCTDQMQIAYLNSTTSPRELVTHVAPSRVIDFGQRRWPLTWPQGHMMYTIRPLDYFAMFQYQKWEPPKFSVAQGVFTDSIRVLDLTGDIACFGASNGEGPSLV